jgi:hypothetical protein
MITILIIRAPKISPLFYNLLELHSSSDYCKLGEDFDHYLYNLYMDMRDDKSKSGIFVTNHNLNLPEYVHYLRTFAEANKVKFIIVK